MGSEDRYQVSQEVRWVVEQSTTCQPLREHPSEKMGSLNRFKQKSLILAQIERWRHALHMQVERQRGLRPGGEWRTGE